VGGGIQGPLGTAATNGLLCQSRVIMMMEKLGEWWLAGETDVLGESLPQCRFVHHKTHMLPGREPGPPRWEASKQACKSEYLQKSKANSDQQKRKHSPAAENVRTDRA
jgi:hypothetical protein